MSTDELPDCEDITTNCDLRIKDMATRRANCACGDSRKGKAMGLRQSLTNLIHHEVKSAYLAGYSQATKDLQRDDATSEKP